MPLRLDWDYYGPKHMTWPYNPERISFSSASMIVEHEFPHRNGAETEHLGRKSTRIDVSGMFLQKPFVPAPSPLVLMDSLYAPFEAGVLVKVTGSELGKAVEGRYFRIIELKGNREQGTVGDIPYSFSLVEHTPVKASGTFQSNTTKTTTSSKSTAPKSSGVRDITYTVRSGDTLWGLAKRYYSDTSKVKDIMSWNKVEVRDMVPGLKLTLKGVPNGKT